MEKKNISFKVLEEDGSARLGKIFTPRGSIDTPTFMTVGTQGTVKSVFIEDVISSGAQIILSNTYHLMIRPGAKRIKRVGGLHNFMNCKLPILTDSGGFQIMSLSKLVKIDKKIDEKLMLKRINQMMSFKTRQKFMQNLEKINLLDGINRVIDKIMHEYEIKK